MRSSFPGLICLIYSIHALSQPPQLSIHATAEELIQNMTLDEKAAMVSGGAMATIPGIERLGLRPIRMSDGPLGVKAQVEGEMRTLKKATGFPSAITMASTWNPNLIGEVGKAIGIESRCNGIDILLGPSVNIHRIQQNGRNFEYFGEDPYLASRLAVSYIRGLQSQGVLANVKHFAANNTEFNRYKSNSIVDERTLREIYFPAFEAAVTEAGSATIMTAHNLLNGIHCSENPWLLDTVLRNEWNFDGFIISDWNSSYDLLPVVKWGVDIEMPMGKVMEKDRLLQAIKDGVISEADIDKKVRHILNTCLRFGLYNKKEAAPGPNWDTHYQLAVKVAEQGTVLLKNQGNLLPLNRSKIKRLAVLGKAAVNTPAYGGGAAGLPTPRKRNMLDEIRAVAGKNIEVRYFENRDLETEANKQYIRNADAAIIACGFDPLTEGEAHDRPFNLPEEQTDLINLAAALNSRTVVTIYAGGGVNMWPWIENVPAVLFAWYMGDATGHVNGRILFGDMNPSGKLPVSIEKHWKDAAAYASYDKAVSEAGMPALFKPAYEKIHGIVTSGESIPTYYNEGILMGYRHFTTKNIQPLFPFGFGLSYTSFAFSNLAVQTEGDSVLVSVTVKNTGKRAGAEVVQVYVQDEVSSVERPVIELKRFQRVQLSQGESRKVSFRLYRRDLSFWDTKTHSWKAEPGTFIIHAGNSSENLPLQQKFNLK
ncbi:MAG: glycoside hydrolase family 3 N-terminal domain-containing protein [Niabella sp.]